VKNTYYKEALLVFEVTQAVNGTFHLYVGNGRRNASVFIENNETQVEPGAPYIMKADDGLVVVFVTSAGDWAGSGAFTFKVLGPQYAWWEKFSIGKPLSVYYAGWIAVVLVL